MKLEKFKPRMVQVTKTLWVLRKAPTVKCSRCNFKGPNNSRSFATRYWPENYEMKPVCHACAKIARHAKRKEQMLEYELIAEERHQRRLKKTFVKQPTLTTAVTRGRWIARKRRRALGG